MICPNCNIAKLEVRQDNYYCPRCQIYIGSVNTPIQNLSTQTATSRWQLQNQILQNSSDKPITDQPEIKEESNIKKYLIPIIILICFVVTNLFINNYSNYLSFSPYCNIKIETKSEEFKRSLIKALDSIKQQDQTAYRDICDYVNTIGERLCPVSDQGAGTADVKVEDHCFVKGSKTIYLNNLEYLRQTAHLSRVFWENQ